MAALGELLFHIVNQKHRTVEGMTSVNGVSGQSDGGHNSWARSISAVAVRSVIEQCLGNNEREDVQNSAANTANNVLARARPSHPLASALVTPEIALRLVDITRVTAAPGLDRILERDILRDKCHVSGSTNPGLSEGETRAMRRMHRGERMIHRRETGDDREWGRQWVHPGGWR